MTKSFGPGMSGHRGPVSVGIDQSYSGFAVAVYGSDKDYRVFVEKFSGRGSDRLDDIYNYLYELIESTKSSRPISDIAMEGYAYGSQMANMLGELGGIVKLALQRQGFYPLIVPPTTLKKYVAGSGRGVQKSQMLLHAYKKWGTEFTDDNACDAFALARIASGTAELAYEQEIVEKLSDLKYREN